MSETTEPMAFETDAGASLIEPETDNQEEVEAEYDEAPVAEQTDADEDETDELDDAETGGEEDPENDSEDEDEDEDDDYEQPELITVKADGEEVQVTLDDLKRAYAGQSHIQKGMKEAADARKQAAEVLEAQKQREAQFLATVQQFQEQGVMQPPKKPSRELLDTDPVAYLRQQAEYEAQAGAYHQQQQQVQALRQQQAEQDAREHAEYLQGQAQQLVEHIPELKDPEKAHGIKSRLIETLADYGMGEAELMGVEDARVVRMLHDLARLKKAKAKGSVAAAEKVKNARPVVKSGAKATNTARAAQKRKLERARKTGTLEDWSSLLLVDNTRN